MSESRPARGREPLSELKDFQRQTVDYVFDRLYGPGATGRFLVADEVGLGKTLVARGVISRAVQHLKAKAVPRIDVIYICSNGDIARQNITRLKGTAENHITLASRLTMLPVQMKSLRETKTGVNFLSFTPGTSLEMQGGLGRWEERVLLYWLLQECWELGTSKAPMNVLRGNMEAERFRERVASFDTSSIDAQAKDDYRNALARRVAAERARGEKDLRARFDELCSAFSTTIRNVSGETTYERARIVGELRAVLAASCVTALEPDLIILDEFQRFSHLLDGEDDASRLARELFTFKDVRVLMLSATPYKMYTATDEADGEDHYRDFQRTLKFLEGESGGDAIEPVLAKYRDALYEIGDGDRDQVGNAKRALEARLRRVMVRTERLASTPDRNGMLVEVLSEPGPMQPSDIVDYLATQAVARVVEHTDTLEYWKSAPYLFNFLDDQYKLKRDVNAALDTADGRAAIARALCVSPSSVLPWATVERYGAVDPGNARLRALARDTLDRGAWRMLWVPPSLSYYQLGAAFDGSAGFTKRLVFSSWRVVPRMLAGMLSYEAERRMFEGDREAVNTPEARKKRAPLLRFARSDGRLTGMPVLALLYPSQYLARACDPAVLARELKNRGEGAPALFRDEVLAAARERIEVGLRRVPDLVTDGPEDERWYWAAPLLLDRALDGTATLAWIQQEGLAGKWAGENEEGEQEEREEGGEHDIWTAHVEAACAVAWRDTPASSGAPGAPLGRRPDDLVDVMAQLAVGGPAVTMFRALDRVVGGESALQASERIALRNGAGRTAWAFRSLFNQPEVMVMLRGGQRGAGELPYWRQVLEYCVDGCLQAVLDEYVHVLRDHLGLVDGTVGARVHEMAHEVCDALRLRTSRVGLDDMAISDAKRTVRREPKRLRTHFALRFGDEPADEGGQATRADHVRKAFNSPFWPFVLATTSVGQEGLDFHTYCHAVVHWNLPTNPVDFEQREGRVHRYKGHAVRKNVAQAHGWAALDDGDRDPWEMMFTLAREGRPAASTDIVPYWVYATEGGARIERHVPMLPMSREREQGMRLARSLAIYRMVFGQPRQDDLVRHLLQNVDAGDLARASEELRIDLSPRVAGSL